MVSWCLDLKCNLECRGKTFVKPQDVWFDELLNSPPLPTLCCACQWGDMSWLCLRFTPGFDETGRAGVTGSPTVRTGRILTWKTRRMKSRLSTRQSRWWTAGKRFISAVWSWPSFCVKAHHLMEENTVVAWLYDLGWQFTVRKMTIWLGCHPEYKTFM